jgi:hypothetical protein
MYDLLLRNEILGANVSNAQVEHLLQDTHGVCLLWHQTAVDTTFCHTWCSLLLYQPSLDQHRLGNSLASDDTPHLNVAPNQPVLRYQPTQRSPAPSPYSLSPLSATSQSLLQSPQRPPRKIPKLPYKVRCPSLAQSSVSHYIPTLRY